MRYDNQANRIRKEVLIRVAKAFLGDRPQVAIDHIPVEMRPKNKDASRCCIYKDREVLKHRAMAAFGFSVEDETDELTPLRDYFDAALQREAVTDTGLTVIDIACSACLKGSYLVTNACRGCFARPCVNNCPKKAISVSKGQAKIDYDLCVDCGKCLDACPYHAVIKVPVPCEDACPVDAVKRRTRAGMGLCQGHTCSKLIARIISEETGKPLAEIMQKSARPPVRPVMAKVISKSK